MALRSGGVPVLGFTWGALSDEIDTQHGLRVERNEANPVGLYDLAREPRPVAREYRELVARWRQVLSVPDARPDGAAESA